MSQTIALSEPSAGHSPPARLPGPAAGPARNGYARLGDLDEPAMRRALGEMESFQSAFMAATRALWPSGAAFTGDCLYNWSRRWEYPFTWLQLPHPAGGRVLDAGSGITFFPFFLERAGFRVSCADVDAGLAGPFETARRALGSHADYRVCGVEALDYPDADFDAVVCVSVLEHAPGRDRAVAELARVLKPGGRLVLTWDLCLSRDGDILMEDVAVLLARLRERFEPMHPLDLLRPPDLLTTDRVRRDEPWRLPWRPRGGTVRRLLSRLVHGDPFKSIAVMGTAWTKKAAGP